jgi:hypothetical protein
MQILFQSGNHFRIYAFVELPGEQSPRPASLPKEWKIFHRQRPWARGAGIPKNGPPIIIDDLAGKGTVQENGLHQGLVRMAAPPEPPHDPSGLRTENQILGCGSR